MAMADEKQTAPIESQAMPQGTAPVLRDKRTTPEGVVPKQAQGYVIAGLAVLILMAVMFSKNHAKPGAKASDSASLAVSTEMNERKIQELEQDLSADQRQSRQQAGSKEATTAAGAPGMSAGGGNCEAGAARSARRCGEGAGLQSPVRVQSRFCRGWCCAPIGELERTRRKRSGSYSELAAASGDAGRHRFQACARGERELRARSALCRFRRHDY
jgi:hypothetical protein